MSDITKEEAAKKLGYGADGKPEKLNVPDLLQQTIDQTVQVTTHNIVDYFVSYIKNRDDYEELKEQYDEIILVMRKTEKRYEKKYEARTNGEDNSSVDSDNNQ